VSVTADVSVLGSHSGSGLQAANVRAGAAVSGAGYVLVIALFGYLTWLFAIAWIRFPDYGPITNVEETAYSYIIGTNFARFGFMNTVFLQDVSSSPFPEDHPYTYNHQPPGSDIFTGAVLTLAPNNFRLLRLIFAALFAAGMACYFLFARSVLGAHGLGGAAYTILFLSPWVLFQSYDKQTSYHHPLMMFAPLVLLGEYYKTGRTWLLAASLVIAFIAGWVVDYTLLAAIVVCWVFLYLMRIVPIRTRDLFGFMTAVALAVATHLLQNLIFLGPNVFVQELLMTLGNRVTGVPSQEEMAGFYRSISVVHHGAHPVDPSVLWRALVQQVTFPTWEPIAITAVAAVVGLLLIDLAPKPGTPRVPGLRESTAGLSFLTRVWIWILATSSLPLFAFPAFAQEVNLNGTGVPQFFAAIGAVATLGYALRAVVARLPSDTQAMPARLQVVTLPIRVALIGLVAVTLVQASQVVAAELGNVSTWVGEFRYARLADIRQFGGHLFMTNINSPTVGLFTGDTGYGVCGLDALPDTGGIDASKCRIAFMRRQEFWATQRPHYYFFFSAPELFPGFADCLPPGVLPGQIRAGEDCVDRTHQRLAAQFTKVFDNGYFQVFDLDTPVAASAPRDGAL
jgi:hypothetical protein